MTNSGNWFRFEIQTRVILDNVVEWLKRRVRKSVCTKKMWHIATAETFLEIWMLLSIVFIYQFPTLYCITYRGSKDLHLEVPDSRIVSLHKDVSSIACAVLCTSTRDCESANYNKIQKLCQLLRVDVLDYANIKFEETGWTNYVAGESAIVSKPENVSTCIYLN